MVHVMTSYFFSSRRRHTRLTCDWSSDVCSSDLRLGPIPAPQDLQVGYPLNDVGALSMSYPPNAPLASLLGQPVELAVEVRSEERRVGRECSDMMLGLFEIEIEVIINRSQSQPRH